MLLFLYFISSLATKIVEDYFQHMIIIHVFETRDKMHAPDSSLTTSPSDHQLLAVLGVTRRNPTSVAVQLDRYSFLCRCIDKLPVK